MVGCGGVWWVVVWCGGMRCGVVWWGVVSWNGVCCGVVWCCSGVCVCVVVRGGVSWGSYSA